MNILQSFPEISDYRESSHEAMEWSNPDSMKSPESTTFSPGYMGNDYYMNIQLQL